MVTVPLKLAFGVTVTWPVAWLMFTVAFWGGVLTPKLPGSVTT